MIFDCFTYSGIGVEDDLLRIRLAEFEQLTMRSHEKVIHVIVEGNMTFTGISKPRNFDASKFNTLNEIGYEFMELPQEASPWDREKLQRNHLQTLLNRYNPLGDDTIIISDLDEIPNFRALNQYRSRYGVCALQMHEHHLFLNTRYKSHSWRHPKILPYSHVGFSTFDEIRNGGFDLCLMDAGTHFSWHGSDADILQKFKSFSHQEEAVQRCSNSAHIRICRRQLHHIITDDDLTVVEMSELPALVQHSPEKFKHMIYVP